MTHQKDPEATTSKSAPPPWKAKWYNIQQGLFTFNKYCLYSTNHILMQ